MLVNSSEPNGEAAQRICDELQSQYGIAPIAVNCLELDETDIADILQQVPYEFPVCETGFVLPRYIRYSAAASSAEQHLPVHSAQPPPTENARDVQKLCRTLRKGRIRRAGERETIWRRQCSAVVREDVPETVFYGIVGEQTGIQVRDDADLIRVLEDFAAVKQQYERLHGALDQVYQTGYGIVMPSVEELSLEEPEIVRQGGRYGVRLRASAPSIHMMRANIKAEVNPIVGTEKQSEELVHYLLSEFEEQPEKIWETNIFGKSLNELVREELSHKLSRMPDDARGKIRETLEKIINESAGGLICIIL